MSNSQDFRLHRNGLIIAGEENAAAESWNLRVMVTDAENSTHGGLRHLGIENLHRIERGKNRINTEPSIEFL